MRSDRGELLSATCADALLVCMFGLEWYGVDEVPGSAARARIVRTENAWQALTVIRWAILGTILVALGSVVLHLSQRSHGSGTSTGPLVAMLGAAAAVLLIYRVLIDMPSANQVVDQKLGAVLGVLFAVGIPAGGWRSVRDAQARRRVRRAGTNVRSLE